jgi:hypothetical protein
LTSLAECSAVEVDAGPFRGQYLLATRKGKIVTTESNYNEIAGIEKLDKSLLGDSSNLLPSSSHIHLPDPSRAMRNVPLASKGHFTTHAAVSANRVGARA